MQHKRGFFLALSLEHHCLIVLLLHLSLLTAAAAKEDADPITLSRDALVESFVETQRLKKYGEREIKKRQHLDILVEELDEEQVRIDIAQERLNAHSAQVSVRLVDLGCQEMPMKRADLLRFPPLTIKA
jgi:hypothetical protein